ncbi:glycosyltransferase family 9 protein [Vibrio fluvialis]
MAFFKKLLSNFFNQRNNKINSIELLPEDPNVIIDATFNIGDYLAISPIIEAIKLQWEKPSILVLCTAKNVDVVKFDPRVDYLLLPDKSQWYKYPSILKKYIKSRVHVDLFVEPAAPDLPHRAIIGFVLKPDLTIGIDYDNFPCMQPPLQKIDRVNVSQPKLYANMMLGYGFRETAGDFKVFEDQGNNLKIEKELQFRNVSNFVVFNPFASTANRSLSIEKSKSILRMLAQEGFNSLFLLPSYIHNKEEWNDELASVCDVFIVNSIHDSICLIKNSLGVVSVDTALVHIASVYDVPTIGLYRDKVINCKNWHPQSSKSHVGLISGPVNEIINTEIFIKN